VYQMAKPRVRQWHRDDVAMIHQDPRAHINPLRTIGDFLTEGLRLTRGVTRSEANGRAIAMLEDVGIDDADRRMKQYPHQLSGGLLQRVMIASALLTEPKLLIADEPTTALDVTTQEEVMAILDELRRERELAMIIITHDLDLAAAVTDRLAVMYAGVIVESGSASTMQAEAKHPYTAGLLASRPSIERREELWVIPGRPVAAWEVETGCTFALRCPFAQQRCRDVAPALRPVGTHLVACHRAEELEGHLTAEGMSVT
jgi:oligopeptide/dipeptide ABC transporter ATP-binding protein